MSGDIRSRRWDTADLTDEDRALLEHMERIETRCSSTRNLRPGMLYRIQPTYLRYHPVAERFPLFDEEAMDTLIESIQADGQVEPIQTYCCYIVDGRNRHIACKRLGIEARCQEIATRQAGWDEVALMRLAINLNVHRRHLTDGQRAARAWEMLRDTPAEHGSKSASLRDMASAAYVSPRSVETARAIDQASPEVFSEVRAGTLSPGAGLVAATADPEVRDAIVSAAHGGEMLTSRDAKAILRAHDVERDGTGRPLPRDLVASYGAIKHALEEIAGTLDGARRTWHIAVTCARVTTGEQVPAAQVLASMPKEARAFLGGLDEAARVLRQAAPYATCPFCRAASLVDGKPCRGCRGSGFLGHEAFKAAPEALRSFTVPVAELKEHR